MRTRTCAYQGVRNVIFSENFAYVLNGWPFSRLSPSFWCLYCRHWVHVTLTSSFNFEDVIVRWDKFIKLEAATLGCSLWKSCSLNFDKVVHNFFFPFCRNFWKNLKTVFFTGKLSLTFILYHQDMSCNESLTHWHLMISIL